MRKHTIGSVLVMALGLVFSGLAVSAPAPAYAAAGDVQCGVNSIVGMWIEVRGGKSDWAKLRSTSDHRIAGWSYDTQGKQWRAHVGCGGTPQRWGRTMTSPWTGRGGPTTITCLDYEGWPNTCSVG
jgi:hypothetical protein